MFDDNEIDMARKILKENLVGGTGEGKRWKGNIGEGSREGKMGTIFMVTDRASFNVPSRG